MNKEAAAKLYEQFEAVTYEWEFTGAPDSQWLDENTPPKVESPVYEVRLDASVNGQEERTYRVRVELTAGCPVNDRPTYLAAIAAGAIEHNAEVAVQNNGIELS